MSVEVAIQDLVREYLEDEGYCTKTESRDIADLIAKDVRELFASDLSEIQAELNRQSERQDRMWDLLHEKPTPKFKSFRTWMLSCWDRVAFWRS